MMVMVRQCVEKRNKESKKDEGSKVTSVLAGTFPDSNKAAAKRQQRPSSYSPTQADLSGHCIWTFSTRPGSISASRSISFLNPNLCTALEPH